MSTAADRAAANGLGAPAAIGQPTSARTPSRSLSPLMDAKAASRLLGVPPSWLLAQARAGKVPHHRLGHYVRFSEDDLARWLELTKIQPRRVA